MLTVIVLSGQIHDDLICLQWLRQADEIICADGGARHLMRLQIKPHLLIGDLDSIDSLSLNWLRSIHTPIQRYPVQKDETDAELAIMSALHRNPKPGGGHGLVVLGALGDRPDHVLAVQMLAVRLASPERAFLLSDGINRIYTLTGNQVLDLEEPPSTPALEEGQWVLSVIPMTDVITGLTYTGLIYPLQNATLEKGSTRGVSNRFGPSGRASLSLGQGSALVLITRESKKGKDQIKP